MTLAPLSESLLGCISACLGPTTRAQGEAALAEQARLPDYVLGLTDILLLPTADLPHRQLAALSLKAFVESSWASPSEEVRSRLHFSVPIHSYIF